jgi:hypothetical protein
MKRKIGVGEVVHGYKFVKVEGKTTPVFCRCHSCSNQSGKGYLFLSGKANTKSLFVQERMK